MKVFKIAKSAKRQIGATFRPPLHFPLWPELKFITYSTFHSHWPSDHHVCNVRTIWSGIGTILIVHTSVELAGYRYPLPFSSFYSHCHNVEKLFYWKLLWFGEFLFSLTIEPKLLFKKVILISAQGYWCVKGKTIYGKYSLGHLRVSV